MNMHSDTATDTKRKDSSTLSSHAADTFCESVDAIGPMLAMGIVECIDEGESVRIRIEGKEAGSVKKEQWYDAIQLQLQLRLDI